VLSKVASKCRPTPHWIRPAAILFAVAVLWAGCSKDHDLDKVTNPADPGQTGLTPPVPVGVQGTLFSRTVELTWRLSDSTNVAQVSHYRIYRAESLGQRILTDSTDTPPALITGLDNGSFYRFQVSTVMNNGLESGLSNAITASPASFGIVIAGGREVTNSQIVTIELQAPAGTQGVRLSNTPDLTEASVQPFTAVRNWEMTPGDGPKTVYAELIDAQGNVSRVVNDSIILDTRAEITSVTFSPSETTPGATVHFRLDAGEFRGIAQVRVGDGGFLVRLRDDGEEGDAIADDGIYERDYLLEQTTELFQVLVTGLFTDSAGNSAEPRVAPGRLTVHADPDPVTLSAPTSAEPRELTLRWSQAADPTRFNSYRLYRDLVPGVATSQTRLLLTEQFTRTQTSFTDTGLDPTRTYYYVVELVDRIGNTVPSNEVSGRSTDNVPPDPVTLSPASEITETSVTLNFTRSFATDFAEYRIYRGLLPDLGSDPDRRLLASIANVLDTRFVDRDEIEENQVYYYQVEVVDDLGATAGSNVVSASIPDRLPNAVTLQQPTSVGETTILLEWSRNDDRDFARYELRRAEVPGVTQAAPLVISITDADLRSHLDTGRRENTTYYYRVFTVDRGGNSVGSREVEVTTTNADPAAVTLAPLTEVGGSVTPSVRLAWGQSTVHDFESYRIFRDTSPSVSEASTLVRTIFEPGVTSFTDVGLSDNERYYYRVFVVDDAEGVTGSNEQSIVTANRAPTPVALTVSATTPTSISLSWTQNADHDFSQYRLLQGFDTTNFPIVAGEFNLREQTSHTIFVPGGSTDTYFFKVVVFDQDIDSAQRLSSESNIVSAQTSTE
jgi:fibronectin type 3 domain-containing protein